MCAMGFFEVILGELDFDGLLVFAVWLFGAVG